MHKAKLRRAGWLARREYNRAAAEQARVNRCPGGWREDWLDVRDRLWATSGPAGVRYTQVFRLTCDVRCSKARMANARRVVRFRHEDITQRQYWESRW